MPILFINISTSTEDIRDGSLLDTALSAAETATEEEPVLSGYGSLTPPVEADLGVTVQFDTAEKTPDVATATVTGEVAINRPVLIGYIIERQRKLISKGTITANIWVNLPSFYVNNISLAGYRDYNVAYGHEYRYRMRSIWKYVTEREGEYGAEYEELKQRLITQLPQCQTAIDMFVRPYKTVYYKSNPTEWVYAQILDTKPPITPDLLIRPDSANKRIIITWISPPESQRDIERFILWRRQRAVSETQELWPNGKWNRVYTSKSNIDNYYVDTNVGFEEEYIYAVQCIDRHKLFSTLSAQIVGKLNKSYNYDAHEHLTWLNRAAGEKINKDGESLELKDRINREVLFCKNTLAIIPKPQMIESIKQFYIRLTSLDTSEQVVIPLTIRNLPLEIDEEE